MYIIYTYIYMHTYTHMYQTYTYNHISILTRRATTLLGLRCRWGEIPCCIFVVICLCIVVI